MERRSFLCCRRMPARCRRSWRRAPSKTSGQDCDDPDCAVHDLFGAAAHLHPADCGLYSRSPGHRRISGSAGVRHAFVVCARISCGYRDGETAQVVGAEVGGVSLRIGASGVPDPTWHSIGLRLLDRGKVFVRQAGTVILAVSLLVWVLTNLPLHNGRVPLLEHSAIAYLGHGIEPVIRPLGFNWKIGVGLLTSVIAREVIVGTLGTIYGVDPATHSLTLQNALHQDLTFAGAMALLSSLRLPCSARPRWPWCDGRPIAGNGRGSVRLHDDGCVCRRLGRQSGSVDAGQVKYGCGMATGDAAVTSSARYFFPSTSFQRTSQTPAAPGLYSVRDSAWSTRHPKCAGSGHPPTRCARGRNTCRTLRPW